FSNITALAYSPDGKTLAAGVWPDSSIRLWDTASGKNTAVLKGHSNSIVGLAFSPDGKTLASASQEIKLSAFPAGKDIPTFHPPAPGVPSSPDGKPLACGGTESKRVDASQFVTDGVIRLWGIPTGKNPATFRGHSGSINSVSCLAFSPDGKTLAAGHNDT